VVATREWKVVIDGVTHRAVSYGGTVNANHAADHGLWLWRFDQGTVEELVADAADMVSAIRRSKGNRLDAVLLAYLGKHVCDQWRSVALLGDFG